MDIIDILFDSLRNGVMITGLVIVMMIMIEFINVRSAGHWFSSLQKSTLHQVLLGTTLGLIPGCVGGFAAVSLYSHRIISFGALIGCMICSSGDESFVMLALFPKQAVLLFAILFVIGTLCGLAVDVLRRGKDQQTAEISDDCCSHNFEIHSDEEENTPAFSFKNLHTLKHPSTLKILTAAGLLLYAVAILTGILEHEHEHSGEGLHFDFLSERWINVIFACLTLGTFVLTLFSNEHFIREHLLDHVIKKHCLRIFLWTAGTLAVLGLCLHYIDIEGFIALHQDYIYLLIIAASVIGMIPESGPHLAFVTLFAAGILPFSVLLASSISQDGHTALPLLASTKRGFIKAKLINAGIAVAAGCLCRFILQM